MAPRHTVNPISCFHGPELGRDPLFGKRWNRLLEIMSAHRGGGGGQRDTPHPPGVQKIAIFMYFYLNRPLCLKKQLFIYFLPLETLFCIFCPLNVIWVPMNRDFIFNFFRD